MLHDIYLPIMYDNLDPKAKDHNMLHRKFSLLVDQIILIVGNNFYVC